MLIKLVCDFSVKKKLYFLRNLYLKSNFFTELYQTMKGLTIYLG